MASRHYHFKFNTERDKTYIARLDAQENMQNYIRRLILSDIAADSLKDVLSLCPDPEPEPEVITDPDTDEYTRRVELMEKYCKATDPDLVIDDDGYICESCPYSYHPDATSDYIRCKFNNLNADEIEEVVSNGSI